MCSRRINNHLIIAATLVAPSPSSSRPFLLESSLRLVAAGSVFDYLVENPELLCLERGQELVALHRGGDGFERLAGVPDVDLVEPRPKGQNLTRLDLYVSGLT